MIIRHVLVSIAVFVSILVLPFWLYLPILFLAIVLVPFFWEGIMFGTLIDIIYGGGYSFSLSIFFSFAFLSLVVLVGALFIRDKLRFHV